MKKFAYLTFADSQKLFIRNKLLIKLPQKIKDWYVLKNNPFLIADVSLFEAFGYKVVLPLLKDDDIEKVNYIIERTLEDLSELGVVITSILPGFEYDTQQIVITNIRNILPFFIIDVAIKALKRENKIIKSAEFLIIDDGSKLTETIIYIIYKYINFLSVFTNRPDYFTGFAADIYSDNGLNLQIIANKSAVNTADVIICTSNSNEFDYFYKRNSIYFGFFKNTELLCKRNDMQVISDLEFRYGESYINLDKLEMAVYVMNENYRKYISRYFTLSDLQEINNFIKNLKIPITSFK